MLDISSPCVRNCCLDEDDICLGCFRSIEEVMQWSGANDHMKLKILDSAKARKKERRIMYEARIARDHGIKK